MDNSSSCGCCCDREASEPRRGFLAKSLALLLGAAAYATPVVVGVVSFLNPLRQKGQSGELLRLASLETLPEGGPPIKTPVIMDRVDAWNRYPNEPVGAVFLRRTGKDKVVALQVVCPHAGCFVDYDQANKRFFCPCHKASFDLEGKRLEANSESPRDLDELEVQVNGNDVLVKFQRFQPGSTDKIAQV